MPKSAAQLAPASPYKLKDETVERWLKTGEQAGVLEDYFGEQSYRELRELAREASARSVRGGPRVLILPGIMGSKLGRSRPLLDDVVWIDPVDIASGRLTQLALTSKSNRIEALGVVLLAYLRLKLKLIISGFDADFFPFDWRLSIDDLATGLVRRLQNERAREVHLVAHSMGGLVARAAIAKNAGKVGRVIMLGTPNFGSFVPVQVLRGTYPIVKKVAFVDLRHTAEELASNVFATFPSLYQMMPAPEKFNAVKLSDIGAWPAAAPRPNGALLKHAGAIQDRLAPSDKKKPFFMIAGVNQETIVGLRAGAGEFQYEVSFEGDGTVPLNFAELPNTTMFYVEESHGSLPNNGRVGAAVADLLNTGKTALLATEKPAPQRALRRVVPESEIGARLEAEARAPRILSQREKRFLLHEVASPEAGGREAPATVAPPMGEQKFDHVIIGRRRQHRFDIKLVCGSITGVDSRAYVLGIFKDVTPSGAARDIDARLEGAVTEFTTRRMFSGNVGEVFMMPAGRHAIRTDIILFVGLGPFDHFDADVQQLVAENVIRTLVRTRVEEFATVFLGAGSGRSTASSLQNMLEGFLRGLRDSDSGQRFRGITLCEIDRKRYDEMKAELYRLLGTPLFEDFEITLDEEILSAAMEPSLVIERQAIQRRDPVYLLLRQEGSDAGKSLAFRASVLTAGEKATVVSEIKEVSQDALNKHLDKLQSSPLTPEGMRAFGLDLCKLVLAVDVASLLYTMRDRHLVVVHDRAASRIPWETLAVSSPAKADVWIPASFRGLSRRYTADNLSIAKWLEERRRDSKLELLLVVNPTGDLPAAETEGKRIQELAKEYSAVSIRVVSQGGATKNALMTLFRSGEFDVVHYAGHAFFDPDSHSRSGIICSGQQVLSGRDLAGLGNLPSLVFFNACEAARIRRGVMRSKSRVTFDAGMRKRVERSVGLAEAFLRGGVANYLGTYWPVGDMAASVFAGTFYRELLKGASIGNALLAGRTDIAKIGSIDWADYVHYGDHEFVLKI